MKSEEWIGVNVKHHDRIASNYTKSHAEIYNKIEQKRLNNALKSVVCKINTNTENILALDFGVGAGNLSGHLLDLGCQVVATDVSKGCLDHVTKIFQSNKEKISTSLLNGKDLSQFNDEQFDLCATYSVLHHVPDYLSVVKELARIVKQEGYIFIDHESSPQSWKSSKERNKYVKQIRQLNKQSIWERWGPVGLWRRIVIKLRKLKNPRYHEEGDIHIWDDDHIEWNMIESVLRENGFTEIKRTDYLVCRGNDEKTMLYDRYKNIYHDMSLMIAKKSQVTS